MDCPACNAEILDLADEKTIFCINCGTNLWLRDHQRLENLFKETYSKELTQYRHYNTLLQETEGIDETLHGTS